MPKEWSLFWHGLPTVPAARAESVLCRRRFAVAEVARRQTLNHNLAEQGSRSS